MSVLGFLILIIFAKQFDDVHGLIFLAIYEAFIRMYMSGIITITNSNSDSTSLWNIPLWNFTPVKVFPHTDNSTVQFFLVSSINFDFAEYFIHFETVLSSFVGPYRMLFIVKPHHNYIFLSRFYLLEDVLINV